MWQIAIVAADSQSTVEIRKETRKKVIKQVNIYEYIYIYIYIFEIKNKHHSTFRLLSYSRSYRVTFEKFLITLSR